MRNTGGKCLHPILYGGVLYNATGSGTKKCMGGVPTLEAMKGADRPFLMSINQVTLIQVTDAKMRGFVIFVYKYFPLGTNRFL